MVEALFLMVLGNLITYAIIGCFEAMMRKLR